MILLQSPYSLYKKYIACRYRILAASLLVSALICYIISFMWVFFYAPDDATQGSLVKIMYIHVPSAWVAMLSYVVMGIAAIIFLSYKNPFFDAIAYTANIVSWHATSTAIITGSIWGKAAWGTWWAWDARLTSMLMQWMMLLICMMLRQGRRGNQTSCIFAVVGLINIPIIKFSVNAWATLHQPSSIMSKNGMAIDSSMLYPLLFSFFSMIIFYKGSSILILQRRLEFMQRSNRQNYSGQNYRASSGGGSRI